MNKFEYVQPIKRDLSFPKINDNKTERSNWDKQISKWVANV